MSNAKKYSEKLKDPRWQRLRLKVMNRDNFKCQICGDTENTLHVHHLKYELYKEPWEYEINALKTLCESCHQNEHLSYQDAFNELKNALPNSGYTSNEVYALSEFVKDIDSNIAGYPPFFEILKFAALNSDVFNELSNKYFESIKK
jgi:hypothetical protein